MKINLHKINKMLINNDFNLIIQKNIIGDWGLGIGDWQSPIPNPQSPNITITFSYYLLQLYNKI